MVCYRYLIFLPIIFKSRISQNVIHAIKPLKTNLQVSVSLILSTLVLLGLSSASPAVRVVNDQESENSLVHEFIDPYDR